jgi:hypothetical protein
MGRISAEYFLRKTIHVQVVPIARGVHSVVLKINEPTPPFHFSQKSFKEPLSLSTPTLYQKLTKCQQLFSEIEVMLNLSTLTFQLGRFKVLPPSTLSRR